MALPPDIRGGHKKTIYDTMPPELFKPDRKATRRCDGCQVTPKIPQQGALLACSRCKSARYCSSECQKRDWVTHKALCILQEGASITKFIERINRTRYLTLLLQIVIALYLDIPGGKVSPDRTLVVTFFVGFEPDIQSLVRMCRGEPLPEKTEGIFQINGILCDKDDSKLSQKNIEMWQERKDQLAKGGREDAFIVLLEYRNRDNGLATSGSTYITMEAIQAAREKNDYKLRLARTGETVNQPMNVATAIEDFNTLLRSDKENRFKMRKPMNEDDIKVLQQAIDEEDPGLCSSAFREKWEREWAYLLQSP
ncbi:hypothetical protein CYLTODRAFT_488858 [Cylindrobasidium torrendii FP15055 ss-10]|uniref:MYND-type domain-containing protein n=1 Tax=Cylindrobasidium torrendii FP15055 ss-10 TaxID=1314674 RepID=A0A0D7BG91_9AGAR|nr:hypothetical protein CYLTODRAFT_488858 [Cylindrobasidium torrendii FP15055 ss-10]